MGFVREANSFFLPWSRDAFFEGQQPINGQKPAIGSIANINQHKIFFLLRANLILFVGKNFSPNTSSSRN